MRLLIGFALLGLAALAGALLTTGAGAQQRSLTLEERTPSSLTVTWSWDAPPAAAFELAWRARGDDDETAWRTVRKAATDRRHSIENLDAGLHYVVRLRGLDAADRPIHDLRGIFATSWSAPRLLRLLASRDGALTIGWSQPSDWNPHGWRLSWRVAGSQRPGGTIDLTAAARSRRIDGLSRGTDYLIRLSALNARGGESPAQTIRATASAATLETPKLTALSWSGLTIRAEWQPVPRTDGYDLFWRASEERGGAVGRLTVTGTSAEFDVPAGAYWVELRARSGEGRAARRSDRTQPRNIILRPAPHYLRVQSFDGEQVRLTWPGADIPEYDLEWGRGGTKQTETRDGRSGLIEVGPLEGGNTYEFRVRARNDLGRSGWSPTAALSLTIWPQRLPLAALDTDGSLYVLWPPAAGAEWYEAQWVNAADRAETARVRVSATPTEGGGIAARIPRDGGFEDGRWLVRVRAGPWGAWSIPHALDLAGQPPRLSLALESSRELCTAGTLTEISWQISGGSAPYALSVENSAVDVSADNIRINCGALTEAETAGEDAALAAKTITAVVTDSRGVQREAALDVARARAIRAPSQRSAATGVQPTGTGVMILTGGDAWQPDLDREGRYLVRHRPAGSSDEWSYVLSGWTTRIGIEMTASEHIAQLTYLRHPLEAETPEALNWNSPETYARLKPAPNLRATATHDTVTVRFDDQPGRWGATVSLSMYSPSGEWLGSAQKSFHSFHDTFIPPGNTPREVVFEHVPPDSAFDVNVSLGTPYTRGGTAQAETTVRTAPSPPGWASPPQGPQNLRATATHNSITVQWDPPYEDADIGYHLILSDAETGRRIDGFHPGADQREWTLQGGLYERLQPNTRYRVFVAHRGLPRTSAEIIVSTLPSLAAQGTEENSDANSNGSVPGLEGLFWPLWINADYDITDDPFTWRRLYDRFHAGLDLGSGEEGHPQPATPSEREERLLGDPVFAVDSGTLLIFNHYLAPKWIVLYCPGLGGPLENQFIAAGGNRMEVNGKRCESLGGGTSGRMVLVVHSHRSEPIVTKYAHLQSIDPGLLELALLDPIRCPERDTASGRIISDAETTLQCRTVEVLLPDEAASLGFATHLTHGQRRINFGLPKRLSVSRGDRIGSVGSSYDGAQTWFDETHLHFEIRRFTGEVLNWYIQTATGCSSSVAGASKIGTAKEKHCHWTPSADRELPTILDVEQHLPPLPASTVPRDHGGWWESAPTTVRAANANRRVFEIQEATIDETKLTAKVSTAFWRPVAYSRYSRINGRTNVAGIASTGPGVTGYGTDITASPTKSDEACGGGAFQPAPVGSGATDEGELPRQTRDISPSLANGPCAIHILTTNALYPTPEALVVPRADDLYRRNVAIPDPKATLDYLGSLTANGAEGTLVGIAFHFYRIGAFKGTRYEICAAPFGAAGCGEEPAARDTRLELFGPDGTRLQVSEDSSLTWVASSDATYVVMVRGGFSEHTLSVAKRESGEDNPPYAGPYALYYRATWLGPIPPSGFARGAITHNSVTVSWTPSDGVHQYVAKSTTGANCNAAGKEERITLSPSDAAEGVSGAAGATVTRRFSGLEPSTDYHLCVRAVRTIEGLVLESGWASTEATTAAAPPDEPVGPTCTPDDSTKPSATQTVTSTETRWTMSGVYEFKEQRTKSQRQTRSVSWQCATSTWTSGSWGDSGDPTYGSWSATGDERCKDPYAAKPAETRTEPVTGHRWVLRGATAHQQKRTGTAHYSRTVTKTGPRACGWTLGEWGSPDRTSWGTWADTGTSEERPVDSETEDRGNGTATRWDVGSSSACEEIEQLQRRRTRSVEFSASNGWTTGSWSVWGAPYRAGWARTGTCLTKPADRTRTVPTLVKAEWRVGSSEACEWTQYSDQPQTKRATWVAPNWVFGGDEDWVDDGDPSLRWAGPGTCKSRPVDQARTVTTRVKTEWRVGSSEACEWTQYSDQLQTKRAEWSDDSESWVFGGEADWRNSGSPTLRWVEPDSCLTKPADKTVTVTERQTRLGPPAFAGTAFCVRYPEQRSRSAYYYQPYVWDVSATAWKLGERAVTPYSYSAWTPWTRTGAPAQPCAFSALPSGSWSLAGGDYELEWSAQRVLFTVPDDASVELSWRARDGGGQEAVFSIAGEGELTVHPDSLGASSGAASGESSERPTLDAVEDSLTLIGTSAD